MLLVAVGCAHGAEPRPAPPCVELQPSWASDVRLCALERPAVRLSGHPYHSDSDRVLLGRLEENGGRPTLRVESYRVYSVEHLFLTLDLESGTLVREEHRVGGAPDSLETLEAGAAHTGRRREIVQEMRAIVALVEAGGTAGPHVNAPHPELREVVRFLDAWLARDAESPTSDASAAP